ncbi:MULTISPECIES: hypothetical protein [Pantoea]|jgi:hypothetical protein|uniref:hypothetical protein n=1 Tax=Pantoea TaxID=53335 RepID=UPI00257E5701|nr:hypothetical protein [Pantoea sp. UBA5960]
MRQTWFTHDPVDTDTANELLHRYAARNIQTQKTLATDPRLWLVSALLPESKREPRRDYTYEQRCWQ